MDEIECLSLGIGTEKYEVHVCDWLAGMEIPADQLDETGDGHRKSDQARHGSEKERAHERESDRDKEAPPWKSGLEVVDTEDAKDHRDHENKDVPGRWNFSICKHLSVVRI